MRIPGGCTRLLAGLLTLWLIACQVPERAPGGKSAASLLVSSQPMALSALGNASDEQQAAKAVSAMFETHLRQRGLLADASEAAKSRYEISGQVQAWQYEGQVSARAVVAVDVFVTDRRSGDEVWSRAGYKKGGRRESISAVADRLVDELTREIPFQLSSDVSGEEERLQVAAVLSSQGEVSTTVPAAAASAGLAVRSGNQRQGASAVITTDRPLQGRSLAFYYGANPPVDILAQYDKLVLEPDNIQSHELDALLARGAKAYAYLSVGEVGPTRTYAASMKAEWLSGTNPAWDSQVLDLSNPDLRGFLLQRVEELTRRGYHGVFLDTMDSYHLIADTDQEKAIQQQGLIQLVRAMGQQFASLGIITNRGFEVLDDIAEHIEAVAAESLYTGWNNEKQQYQAVPEADRNWLLGKLQHARETLNLDVIAIDYLPPSRRDEARAIARQIASQGFIPWVANPSLDYVGVGALEVIPRKVLLIHDTEQDGPRSDSLVHRFTAMPIEYMGYVPEYVDLATDELPRGELKGRYAGIVTWARGAFKHVGMAAWLHKQMGDTVPVVFMGTPPTSFTPALLRTMGVRSAQTLSASTARIAHQSDLISPERRLNPRLEPLPFSLVSQNEHNTVHLSYEDAQSQRSDLVVTGPFGGFALTPGDVENGINYTSWVVEPFEFLRTALQLEQVPMPDVTSENGKRLWLAHIDGDALPSWAEMPGKQLGAEVIYDDILEKYRLPHTISVVEGEMTQFAAYDDRRERMFAIARKTFELDHVELASHTFSHPFKWAQLREHRFPGTFNLDVEGYLYSAERETAGSIAFIDRELAPAGKRTQVMLWSGDALPGEADLAVLDSIGIPNMNGGVTIATNALPYMTLISPMALPVGPYVQVYAPIMNENIYTNDWLGPFDGFRKVVETFTLTEYPRRIKPINIYYHFYSGTKISAMRALDEVYQWSLAEDIFPLYVSEFSRKIPDFRKAGVARYLTGEWKLSGLGQVRSIRLLNRSQWPVLDSAEGLVGVRLLHDGVYMHTNGEDSVIFRTAESTPVGIHLVSSNGRVVRWQDEGGKLSLQIAAHVPVEVELGGLLPASCTLDNGLETVRGDETADGTLKFNFTTLDTGNAILYCPA